MGSFTDRVRGFFNIGTGRLKQGLARDTQDPNLKMEGQFQTGKGHVQKTMGDVKENVGNAVHDIASRIKRTGT